LHPWKRLDLLIAVFQESGLPFVNVSIFQEILDDDVTIFFVEMALLEGQTAAIDGILEFCGF
jgi:hypothetical protein